MTRSYSLSINKRSNQGVVRKTDNFRVFEEQQTVWEIPGSFLSLSWGGIPSCATSPTLSPYQVRGSYLQYWKSPSIFKSSNFGLASCRLEQRFCPVQRTHFSQTGFFWWLVRGKINVSGRNRTHDLFGVKDGSCCNIKSLFFQALMRMTEEPWTPDFAGSIPRVRLTLRTAGSFSRARSSTRWTWSTCWPRTAATKSNSTLSSTRFRSRVEQPMTSKTGSNRGLVLDPRF